MANNEGKSGQNLSDLYERLEELEDRLREPRGRGGGRRRRGGFPPFMPVPPPAMIAWLASWALSPRRGDCDFDLSDAMQRFADTRDDFWDHVDDSAHEATEAMADFFRQFANATGRDGRRRHHPRIDMDELEKKLAGMDEEHKQEVLESVRRSQRMNEWVERGRKKKKDE